MAVYGWAARAILRFGPSVPHAATAVAILNMLDVVSGLNKIANALGVIGRRGEDTIGEEIVELARQRGPDDTYRLERGTTWRRVEDQVEIVASAAREVSGSEDYAWFVERGTSKMDARPFFWGSAREVFDRQGRVLEDEIDSLADEFNGG